MPQIERQIPSPKNPIWQLSPESSGIAAADLRQRLEKGFPAQIPGAVHQALLAAGIIDDPFYADRARDVEWIGDARWILTIPLVADADLDAESCRLALAGVDTYAKVHLNGIEIGRTANAFRRYVFPAGAAARHGVNQLRLEFEPVNQAVGAEAKVYPSAFGDPARVHVRRMQCTFGWDWVHRFATFGLAEAPRLLDGPLLLFPACLTLDVTARRALAQARWDTEALPSEECCEMQLDIQAPDGAPVLHKRFSAESGQTALEIPDPQLWFPRGYGGQPLYSCTWTLLVNGSPCGAPQTTASGIRKVEFLDAFDAPGSANEVLTRDLARALNLPPERGREFGFRINGAEVFALGGNWVPCDPFLGPDVEFRKEAILRTLAASGANTLRVWGGGIYESDHFYRMCDKLGILVLQDFMMACAEYPADAPAFMDNLKPEVVQAVQRLRKYTSIIHWYGDNENAMKDGETATGRPWREIFERIVRPALEKHDGTRPATPSSPFFGNPNADPLQGDSHLSGIWSDDRSFYVGDMRDYKERLDRRVGRFMSECGLFGAPSIESLLRFFPEERLDDPELWEFHTKDNPYRPQEITLTLFQSLEKTASGLFGPFANQTDRLHKLAYAHYETVRLAVEAARRKQPFCRGLLFWMLNDCWPASGWSLIDYYARPKAGYYGLLHASRKIHCSFRSDGDRIEAWVSNFALQAATRDVQIFFETWDGRRAIIARAVAHIPPGGSRLLTRFDAINEPEPGSGVYYAASEESENESGWHFHGMPFQMTPPATLLEVETIERSGSKWMLAIRSSGYARVVTFRGPAIADDNYFDLRAGEVRRVTLQLEDGADEKVLGVEAWNAPRQSIMP